MNSAASKSLGEAIATLNTKQRNVLRLKYCLDFSYQEIGYITAQSPENARTQTRSIRESLEMAREAPVSREELMGFDWTTVTEAPSIDGTIIGLLRKYVRDEEAMEPAECANVEMALRTLPVLREQKAMLEREPVSPVGDVTGHFEMHTQMPSQMLCDLLQYAVKRS